MNPPASPPPTGPSRLALALIGLFAFACLGSVIPWVGAYGFGSLFAKLAPGSVRVRGNLDEALGYLAVGSSFVVVPLAAVLGAVLGAVGDPSRYKQRWLILAAVLVVACVALGVAAVTGR